MRLISALVIALSLIACSQNRVQVVELSSPVDGSALYRALEEDDGDRRPVSLLGEMTVEGRGRLIFGAYVEHGRGLRMDVLTSSGGRLVLKAVCDYQKGCEGYAPDENTLVVERNVKFGPFLEAVLTGRPWIMEKKVGAFGVAGSDTALKYEDGAGNWEIVLFSTGSKLPHKIIFGGPGAEPKMSVALGDYKDVGGRLFPHSIDIGGEGGDYRLAYSKVQFGKPSAKGFELTLPENAKVAVRDGAKVWNQLGLSWIPQN